MGNLLVLCVVEMANTAIESGPLVIYAFWTFGFIASSAVFFQTTKLIMRQFHTPERVLPAFDVATLISIIAGIAAIIIRM